MSRVSKMIPKKEDKSKVVNHMGGVSFTLNPIDSLKMVASSSMLMEPTYYEKTCKNHKSLKVDSLVAADALFKPTNCDAGQFFIDTIQNALDYDFKRTIETALELRKEYLVRVVPQLIMVLAAKHPSRAKFDEENPGVFRKTNVEVMQRADEPATQLACWLWLNDWKKNKIPSVLKRSWADRIEKMTAYEAAKYKNAETGLINLVRICHAKGDVVSDLMTDGKIELKEDEKTWENLRSAGKTFKEIFETIKMPHMALLRNMRNILDENENDSGFISKAASTLVKGVKNGKQFPFRYYTAHSILADRNPIIGDTLEECIDVATEQLPKLKGKTICLSDNSGSAWGQFTSEFGSMTVAKIDNLSSIIAASRSDEGYVGKFGDRLKITAVSKRNGLLAQAEKISSSGSGDVGGSTENGIWLFFKDAIKNKTWYDNIFIFSDQQAGHGGLYGIGEDYIIDGDSFKNARGGYKYVDVLKLLKKYRSTVNPKVNFFTVQTAGYDNAVIPEFIYRGAVLCGWTGKEVNFAAKLIEQWDAIEENKDTAQKQ